MFKKLEQCLRVLKWTHTLKKLKNAMFETVHQMAKLKLKSVFNLTKKEGILVAALN